MTIFEDVKRVISRSERVEDIGELRLLVSYLGDEYIKLHSLSAELINWNNERNQGTINDLDAQLEKLQMHYRELVAGYREGKRMISAISEIVKHGRDGTAYHLRDLLQNVSD